MLLSGGLFAGGVSSIAWERIPAWRPTDLSQFRTLERLGSKWLRGHLVRTAGALACSALAVVAAVL
jgi:hypothetical protein